MGKPCRAEPSRVLVHIRMLDKSAQLQQEAVGGALPHLTFPCVTSICLFADERPIKSASAHVMLKSV